MPTNSPVRHLPSATGQVRHVPRTEDGDRSNLNGWKETSASANAGAFFCAQGHDRAGIAIVAQGLRQPIGHKIAAGEVSLWTSAAGPRFGRYRHSRVRGPPFARVAFRCESRVCVASGLSVATWATYCTALDLWYKKSLSSSALSTTASKSQSVGCWRRACMCRSAFRWW
jgi:hypothetical protein